MKLLYTLVYVIFLLVFVFPEVQSRRSGPPLDSIPNTNNVCNQLVPSHSGNAQFGNGGYIITTDIPRFLTGGYNYTAGQMYTGKFNGVNSDFKLIECCL